MRRAGSALLDAALVVLFVVLGRRAHHHGDGLGGVASTAAPFLVGLALGWVAIARRREPWRVRAGLWPWAGAWVAGLILRAAVGQGVDLAFTVVAGAFLGLFLLGWRVLARAAQRRR